MTETRIITKFSWTTVDDRVIRALFRAYYDSEEAYDEAVKIRRLTTEQLHRNAKRILGQPPATNIRRNLTPQLVEAWLPLASAEQLAELTAVLNRFDPLPNKPARLAFLRTKRNTTYFRTQLR